MPPTDKHRRDAERRRLQRRSERRAVRDARRRRFALIGSIVGVALIALIVVVVVVATSNDHSTPAASSSSPTTSSSSVTTGGPYPCTWTTSGSAAKAVHKPSTTTPPKVGLVDLEVQTSRGPMTFQLDRSLAPCTVESFVSLAEQGYFNSTPCHRLTSSAIYVLQCGDPSGTGTGGPGYTIPDEATGLETYTAGTIAMARRTGVANSGGSQFFIVYKDSPNLQQHLGTQQYTVFGFVKSGLNVVEQVAAHGSNPPSDGKPKLSISLTDVRQVK